MRKLLLWCLFNASCLPHVSEVHYEPSGHHALGVFAEAEISHLEQENLLIIRSTIPISVKDLAQRIALIKSPEFLQHMSFDKDALIPLSIKSIERGHLFSVKPKKLKLQSGSHYGVYVKDTVDGSWELKHALYVRHALPHIIRHDVGEASGRKIPKNRINFLFEFDNPIYLPDDEAVRLLSKTGQALKLSSMRVSSDLLSLRITLDKNPQQFEEGQEYAFHFNRILNADGHASSIDPIKFVVEDLSAPLKELAALNLDIGHDGAEISWHLNNDHYAEIFFGEDLAGNHDCLGTTCPRIVPVMPSKTLDAKASYFQRVYVSGLKPNRGYHFVIRAEDHQGQILVAAGVINTKAKASLRFSEVLINPKMKGNTEHNAEFLELLYLGAKPQQFFDLELVFQSLTGDEKQSCEIASSKNPLELAPGQRVIIVGHEYEASQLAPNAKVVRLPHKKICGGLGNSKPKIIKVMKDKAVMLDRFGGHLWQAPEGLSVIRRDPEGLDELDNYCYCDELKGPTPGGPP